MILDLPLIETERLILRGPLETDFDAVAAFQSSPRAKFVGGPNDDRFQAWRGFLSVLGHWALRGYGIFSLQDKSTGALVGRAGVICHDMWPEPELGFHVFDGFEGKGYAFEAALAARTWAYQARGLGPLLSFVHPDNLRSRRLAERLGAVVEREGVLVGHPCLYFRHPKPEVR